MDIEQFEPIAFTLGTTGLMLYMTYIIYRLGKDSGAGKFGFAVLFLALGLGMFGFVAKYIIMEMMKV